MTSLYTVRLGVVAAGTLALGLSYGAGTAMAASVAGANDTPGVESSVGTDVLQIQLSQGNPDEDGKEPSGLVSGVNIHLDRLKGISPYDANDKKSLENASLREITEWDNDLKVSGVTDGDGVVRFDDLAEGIYLVSSTAPGDGYREINSFLVAVPFHTVTENPEPVPGVIVAKSHNPGDTPPKDPLPSETPPNDLPQGEKTVDDTSSADNASADTKTSSVTSNRFKAPLANTGAQVIGVLIAGTALVGSGLVLIGANRKKRQKENVS